MSDLQAQLEKYIADRTKLERDHEDCLIQLDQDDVLFDDKKFEKLTAKKKKLGDSLVRAEKRIFVLEEKIKEVQLENKNKAAWAMAGTVAELEDSLASLFKTEYVRAAHVIACILSLQAYVEELRFRAARVADEAGVKRILAPPAEKLLERYRDQQYGNGTASSKEADIPNPLNYRFKFWDVRSQRGQSDAMEKSITDNDIDALLSAPSLEEGFAAFMAGHGIKAEALEPPSMEAILKKQAREEERQQKQAELDRKAAEDVKRFQPRCGWVDERGFPTAAPYSDINVIKGEQNDGR